MEEEIINLLKMKNVEMLLYQDVIDELDLTEKQQMILISKFKSFKRLEKTYRYNEHNRIETFVRFADDFKGLHDLETIDEADKE